MIRIGMIGYSQGNGHPFSFSAIFNGYHSDRLHSCGWSAIADYLDRRDPADIGINGARVTHAWCPDPQLTRALQQACNVPKSVSQPSEMIGSVDAVIIARDDAESHRSLALPFLEAGLPIFVDKPLCCTRADLEHFLPYVEKGQLMSCSGLRYACELDELKLRPSEYSFVTATVMNDWERYGIHMLEAISSVLCASPASTYRVPGELESFRVEFDNGTTAHIHAAGPIAKAFHLDFFGPKSRASVEISDNFCAFKRTLTHFCKMVTTKSPPIAPDVTAAIIESVIQGLEQR